MKNLKKVLALTLSAAMALGMTMTSMAAEPEVSVDAPIYAYDITNVVVPTSYVVAFNPNGLDVKKNGTVVNDQIVSKNYGIINKSTQNKVITVTLKVEDLNEDKITFVADPADVTNAPEEAYVINLTMVPADATEVQVGTTPASADLTTTGADLANATMTGATGSAKVLVAGENDVDFLLEKASYTGEIDLDNAADNNVADNFTLTALAGAGKGITAFTFGGTMNTNTDWTKLTKGIKITAVYSNENAPAGATAVTGTGALFVNPNPVFRTGSEVGVIKYNAGTSATDALDSITSITMDYNGVQYDGYHALAKGWAAATDENGIITFSDTYISNYLKIYPNDMSREATISYTTVGGDSKTATVDVKLQKPVVTGPTFEMGSEVGTITYEVGTGDDALASIKSIVMDYGDASYDGYNALGSTWPAASDVDGKITLPSKYMNNYITKFPTDTTREAIVTYVTVGGDTRTTTVNVKLK